MTPLVWHEHESLTLQLTLQKSSRLAHITSSHGSFTFRSRFGNSNSPLWSSYRPPTILSDYYFILHTKSDVRKLWTNLGLSLGKTCFYNAISSLNIDPNGKIKIRGQTERPNWAPAASKLHISDTSNFIVGWDVGYVYKSYMHALVNHKLEFNEPNSVLYLYLSFHKNNHCLCFLIIILAITNRVSYEGQNWFVSDMKRNMFTEYMATKWGRK